MASAIPEQAVQGSLALDGQATEPEPKPEPELSAADLRAALLESQRREREANERLNAERVRLDSLMRPAQPIATPAPAPEPLGAMPDPSVDPEAFAKWIDRRDAERERKILGEINRHSETISQQQAGADLWMRFCQRYPTYSDLRDLATFAFQRVIPSYGGSIPTDTRTATALIDDVKRTMDEIRGGAAVHPSSQSATRTAGVSAGSGGTSRSVGGTPSAPAKKSSTLADDIVNWQIQAGYI